jgi:hypothetical protein
MLSSIFTTHVRFGLSYVRGTVRPLTRARARDRRTRTDEQWSRQADEDSQVKLQLYIHILRSQETAT